MSVQLAPMKLDRADSELAYESEASNSASQNDVPVLRRAAMDYLARREHSFYELQQKLNRKFPDTQSLLLQKVLLRLWHENLQSDDRFTEAYVRYRKSRGFGFLHIRAELLIRKIDESLIHKYLQVDDSDWVEIANQQLEKKLTPGEVLLFGSKTHRKLVRFLESRGFGSSNVRKILDKRLSNEPVRH